MIRAKPWTVALGETKNKAVETGADGVDAMRRMGVKTFMGAKAASGHVGEEIARRVPGRNKDESTREEGD